MADKNLMTPSTTSLSGLLGNGVTYKVPVFQTDYSWKDDNWNDLWEDIKIVLNTGKDHYMGAVVLQKVGEKVFLVIDGQQRFTTLSLLALATIKKIQDLIIAGIEPENNTERINELRRGFLGQKSLSLLFLFVFLSLVSMSQSNSQTEKECRITSGIGFAGATKNTKSVGQYLWFQLDYNLSKNISLATEFENMTYQLRGIYPAAPPGLGEIKSVDDNFSLLFKYHLLIDSPLKVAFASGWTYTIRTSEYYNYEMNSTTEHWYIAVRTIDNYQIPLLLELEYPLWKKVNVQARAKYNLNRNDGSTYSGGVGLSLRL